MKILEIITDLGSGGAERFVVDLSNELANSNDVTLMTLLDDNVNPEHRNFNRYALDSNVAYYNLGLPNGLKMSSQLKVLKAIKAINPDIIHVHMACTLNHCALAVICLAMKFKIYFTIHNDIHNGYDKGLVKLLCNTYGHWGRFKSICLSEKNYNDFKSFYGKAPDVRCIVNGRAPMTPTDLYEEANSEMNGYRSSTDSKLLLHVARFNPIKNQNLLIDAFNQLIDEGYSIDLVIIGNGFETDGGMLLQSKANKRVHFIGTRKNVADYMLNADIFCLSSDFEGMPITLLEASLAGMPAVSTPVCGAVDLIQDGINGFLSRSHSLEDYKSAVIKAIENFDGIKANAMKMKDSSPYTIAECAKKYLDYFKETTNAIMC